MVLFDTSGDLMGILTWVILDINFVTNVSLAEVEWDEKELWGEILFLED